MTTLTRGLRASSQSISRYQGEANTFGSSTSSQVAASPAGTSGKKPSSAHTGPSKGFNLPDQTYKVSRIPGDGIGPEISESVKAIYSVASVPITWEERDVAPVIVDGRSTISQDAIDSIHQTPVALKGPLATPIGNGHVSLNLTLRRTFKLFANIRPCRSIVGFKTPYEDVNSVLIRENGEGDYSGIEHKKVAFSTNRPANATALEPLGHHLVKPKMAYLVGSLQSIFGLTRSVNHCLGKLSHISDVGFGLQIRTATKRAGGSTTNNRGSVRQRMFSEYRSKGYEEAIAALNSLQSNASVLAAIQAAGPQPSERVFGQTNYYLRRLGYKPKDLNVLNAIHISGTKGKGSTAAFCSSLLNTINPSAKVGLFTSPHLVAVRERIRINGKPISEEMFSKYFWELWERFEDGNGEPVRTNLPIRPAYFRYLTYMAYHAFMAERMDATVFEVGVGGLLDPTNLIPSPIVTGVSSLGIDHVNVLGHSIAEIAGHKGGIFKPGVPALSVQQQYPETINVLRARALELKSSSFTIIPCRPDLDQLKIGLAGSHQKHNASFAIALVNTFLGSPRLPPSYSKHASPIQDTTALGTPLDLLPPLPSDPSPTIPESVDHWQPELPKELVQPKLSGLHKAGITNTRWPGRCQTIVDPVRSGVTWFLDGAHTVDSLELCGQWWNQQLESSTSSSSTHSPSDQPQRILIFNCTFGRKARDLLEGLIKPLSQKLYRGFFDQVIITSNTTYSDGKFKSDLRSVAQDTLSDPDQRIQQEIAEAWMSMSNSTKNVMVVSSIEQAVDEVTRQNLSSGSTSVLVTGSLHLIGGLLDVLGFEDAL